MGESDDTVRISPGIFARDKEGDEFSRVVVIRQEEKQAYEYVIDGIDKTVSEYNPNYPASASVVTVVFEDDLREYVDGWEFMEIDELWNEIKRQNLRTYTYPEPRLELYDYYALNPLQKTDDGLLHSPMIHVTNVGKKLVFGKDYQFADHQHGSVREVCFHRADSWNLRGDNVVSIKYQYESPSIDGLPTMLCSVEKLSVNRESPDWDAFLSL